MHGRKEQKAAIVMRGDVELPTVWNPSLGFFRDDARLEFRFAADADDIAALAKTEDYGSRGHTNVPQVTGWWQTYPRGNLLATYDGQIIGGIEIWPISARAYFQIARGELAGEDVRPEHITPAQQPESSFWYLASISLAAHWRERRERHELLVRLLVTALQTWRQIGIAFPAHVVTESWTPAGRNILRRLGFAYFAKVDAAAVDDPTFARTFSSTQAVSEFIDQLKSRLK